MSVNSAIKNLANEIKSTREFKKLKQARRKIDKHSNIKRDLQMLQKKQMQLYKSKKSPKQIEKESNEIKRQFQKLSKMAEVNELSKAGEDFNKIMSSVYKELYKILDLEL